MKNNSAAASKILSKNYRVTWSTSLITLKCFQVSFTLPFQRRNYFCLASFSPKIEVNKNEDFVSSDNEWVCMSARYFIYS